MNIYLAGRLDKTETTLASFAKKLEYHGHNVVEKWFLRDPLPRPYFDNLATSSKGAKKMINAAYDCDVFILFATDDILGAAIEFGAALASTLHNSNKTVIVVTSEVTRQSAFYAHPNVILVNNIEMIRQLPWF